MDYAISEKAVLRASREMNEQKKEVMALADAMINKEYIIQDVKTDDEELKDFLFTLGCYAGEKITVISALGENFVIAVKDARYSIDKALAEAIVI